MVEFKQKQFISAVIYIHNAQDTISEFLDFLYSTLSSNFEDFEIICIDDASADKSKDKIREFAKNHTLRRVSHATHGIISLISMNFYQGMETVMRAGVDLAIGDFIFEFDEAEADYDPMLILQAFNCCLDGFDIVSCGRGNMRLSSILFYSIYNHTSDSRQPLQSETFRIISRRAVNRIHSMSVSIPYRKALYSGCGLKREYIKYKPVSLVSGKKKKRRQGIKNPVDTALTSLLLFTDTAYKVTISLTLIMIVALVSCGIYVLAIWSQGIPIEGFTPIMLVLSASFSALFTVLTIIIKYLSVILRLVFNKQNYIIESIERIGNIQDDD